MDTPGALLPKPHSFEPLYTTIRTLKVKPVDDSEAGARRHLANLGVRFTVSQKNDGRTRRQLAMCAFHNYAVRVLARILEGRRAMWMTSTRPGEGTNRARFCGLRYGRGPGRRSWRTQGLVAVAPVATVLALATPTGAIPTDPDGGNACASASSAWVTVSASSIALGQTTTVSWSFSPGRGCSVGVVRLLYRDATTRAVVTDTGKVGSNGSATLVPQNSGAYYLQAFMNGWFVDFDNAPVSVELPVVNGRPTVEITQPGQNALFAEAVGVPKAVVRIAGYLDLDLSGMSDIFVASGVEIIGERTLFPKGPRLFTRSFPRHLMNIGTPERGPSDNVRISGLRLEGGESSDPCDSAGVEEDADAIDVFSSQHIEIDHNELYRWRGSTVNIHDPAGRINKENAATAWVHDNFMHDNQHPTYCGLDPFASGHGGGYGVSVAEGGFALIERNVFDSNRHAIAGHGSPGDGYLLYRNLFLYPGVDSEKLGFTHYNHQIDMHGLETCGSGEHFNCGAAGEYMDVAWNTIVSRDSDAIQLRGIPSDPRGMSVHNNVFAQSHDSALTQTQTGLHDDGGNYFYNGKIDLAKEFSTTDRGTCDFDRDGINDAFAATGVTWWYFSSLVGHYVYLNQSSGIFASDFTLSDVNGDGRCDVTAAQGTFLTPSSAPFDVTRPPDQAATVGHATSLQLGPDWPTSTFPSRMSFIRGRAHASSSETQGRSRVPELGSLGSVRGVRVGPGPLTWAATGLPPGLWMGAGTGRISGTPIQAGSYPVRFGASDAHGDTVYGFFRWTVNPQ
jgi:hypothetical protein